MSDIYTRLKNPFFTICLLVLPLLLSAQPQLRTDRANATYNAGEQMSFVVRPSASGTVNYKIFYDNRTNPIVQSSIQAVGGQDNFIPFTLNEPGVVFCEVEQFFQTDRVAAAFSPYSIQQTEPEPGDFDAFWNARKSQLAAVPMSPQLQQVAETQYTTTYQISLAQIDNRRVYGYLSVPKGGGTYPAIVEFPAFGSNPIQPSDFVAERAGALYMNIVIHNAPANQTDPNAYQPDIIDNPQQYYFRWAILAGIRSIDYLTSRPDWDGSNVALTGDSQGGALATMVAGLDNRVNLITIAHAAYAEHAGNAYGKASGFPFYLQQAQEQGYNADAVRSASRYYDAINFAKRYDGKVLSFLSWEDEISYVSGNFAVFNQFSNEKIVMHWLPNGHNPNPQEYWNGRYDFWRRHIPSTQSPPWPWPGTTTGYAINAGSDIQSNNNQVSLNGTVELNGQTNPGWPVEWSVISGPGNVSFSNANSYNTNANFSAQGTYRLRFTAIDESPLSGQQKYWTLMDEITVTVGSGGNPTTNITLNCPNDLSFEIPNGATGVSVNWTTPTASSTCNGNVSVFQTGGISNFSFLGPGTYTVSYQATDNCGNVETCNFNVNVTAATNPTTDIALNCPGDLSFEIPAGATGVSVNWTTPTASSTCNGNVSVFQTGGVSNFSFLGTGTYNVSYQATDNCGNVENCNFNINVTAGNTGGGITLNCSDDLLYELPAGTTETTLTWNEPTVSTSCGGSPTIFQSAGIPNNITIGIGVYTVSYRAKDNCGNVEDCTFTITVAASGNPPSAEITLNCPGDLYYEIPTGVAGVTIDWNMPTASTTCNGNANVFQTSGIGDNSFQGPGTYAVTYRATDNCGNVEDCSFNVVITNATNPPPTGNYCAAMGNAPWQFWVQNVRLNEIDNSTSKEQYGDFTGLSATITSGRQETISLSTGYSWAAANSYWRVWIDFNQNNVFESNEMVVQTTQTGVANGTPTATIAANFTVPSNAAEGSTRMRVSMSTDGYTDACETFANGEVEDYTVVVSPLSANLTPNCTGNIEVTAPQGANGMNVFWNEPTGTTTCGNPNVYVAQTAGGTSGSYFGIGTHQISYNLGDNCGNITSCSFTIVVLEESNGGGNNGFYCEAEGLTPSLDWIRYVQFSAISNYSGKEGYADFTNRIGYVQPGETRYITLEPGRDDRHAYWSVYIDFNGDNDFDDANELALQVNGYGSQGTTFNIPYNAAIGETRMRIVMKRNVYHGSPCGFYGRGEVEDYTLMIVNGFATMNEAPDEDEVNQNQEVLADPSIKVYPNPAIDGIFVQLGEEVVEQGQIDVYNLAGVRIKSIKLEGVSGAQYIDLSTYENGMYMIAVKQDKRKLWMKPIVLERY